MKKVSLLPLLTLLAPSLAFAAVDFDLTTDGGGLKNFANNVGSVLDVVVMVLVTIAVFVIIWGIFQFVVNAGDAEKRAEGRSRILWGVIGVFLLFSVWGLINILLSTFALTNENSRTIPSVSPGGFQPL
ncbi:MAG: hypothetical protein A2664_04200 [Candidatus Taylorbacteria bacterium RIFCSPHIGHO2_01_FULL_46_22b]|uniref:Uncharacterized protein n=1 Tax=Candidatus Taylorbacteria bacterium RIFCSPHIGHO2_01_FULL_46_22b TaxID=1802301 RepID=A0A1G2M1M0_9BACT|nr:MAG: hypothetical protein A2664_04200 [Candidatus Taylorbacteria bacterium RIFCSPHIGHO2_01_FULL_46_22b]